MRNRVVVKGSDDVLVFQGKEIDYTVLEAIIDTNKRLLWAFVEGEHGDVRAVPYDESHVIWMSESDILSEQDVEI